MRAVLTGVCPARTVTRAVMVGSAALGHITVCDLSGQLAGAGATRYLAAFGARVIRVEDPIRQGRWDIIRGSIPHVDERRGIEMGGGFNNHNVEKLGVTINLRLESGRSLLRRLIAVSDVVTENFAAGVMARMGFSYEDLRAVRNDIIYVSNSGFGHTGPYSAYKSFGPVVQAVCGLTFGVGAPDTAPAGWGYSHMDHMGANLMAVAILAALAHRNRTGEGQWVDMSCTEAGLGLTGPDLLDYTVNGRPLRRPDMPDSNHSDQPPMAPHGIYPTSGGRPLGSDLVPGRHRLVGSVTGVRPVLEPRAEMGDAFGPAIGPGRARPPHLDVDLDQNPGRGGRHSARGRGTGSTGSHVGRPYRPRPGQRVVGPVPHCSPPRDRRRQSGRPAGPPFGDGLADTAGSSAPRPAQPRGVLRSGWFERRRV